MRTLLALAIAVGVPAAASALPPAPLETGPAVTLVQNRFLPGFLGGGDRNEQQQQPPNGSARLEQLESQVRMLTGQVEQLTFSVRRLEQMLQQQGTPQQQGALAGPGAPPRPLGTLPATGPSDSAATSGGAPAGGSSGLPGVGGPIDLSVLNNGASGGIIADNSSAATTTTTTAGPAAGASPALDNVRRLQSSGRYAMAADEARAVLAGNPNGEVAGEARYLLGEVLLAQGDYRAAANQFLENYTADPNNARAPQSLLQLGKALNQLGEREAACSSLDELFGAYPGVDGELRAAAERERQAANCA